MKPLREISVVRIERAVEAFDARGRRLLVPAGSVGTIVGIHGSPLNPQSYDIDFYLEEQGSDVLAVDVDAIFVTAEPA